MVSHGIDLLKSPSERLGIGSRPSLAPGSDLAVRHILNLQLEPVPSVRLPSERRSHGSSRLRLPGFELQFLTITKECQRVALSNNARVAHLPTLLGHFSITLHGVVRPTG